MSNDVTRVPAERLAAFIIRAFTAAGVPPAMRKPSPTSWSRPICAAAIPMA